MDNKNRNIHNSGPLGVLLRTGQVSKLSLANENLVTADSNNEQPMPSYFKTESGIEFGENELTYVDPKECEPWKYANRQGDELGDIEGLIQSIKANKQLQPALIRNHPNPHDGIKYEVIFGRRRHLACAKLSIPFLVIRKDLRNVQDAIMSQDAENKYRKDISNYSNAKLYKKLLEDRVFVSEKDLADKLNLSSSTLNDLMAYAKLPDEIVDAIPDIHTLSKSFALKINSLLAKSNFNHNKLLKLAPQIGVSITSPNSLDNKMVEKKIASNNSVTKQYKSMNGKRLFTLKNDQRGNSLISLNKEILNKCNIHEICERFKLLIENEL